MGLIFSAAPLLRVMEICIYLQELENKHERCEFSSHFLNLQFQEYLDLLEECWHNTKIIRKYYHQEMEEKSLE